MTREGKGIDITITKHRQCKSKETYLIAFGNLKVASLLVVVVGLTLEEFRSKIRDII